MIISSEVEYPEHPMEINEKVPEIPEEIKCVGDVQEKNIEEVSVKKTVKELGNKVEFDFFDQSINMKDLACVIQFFEEFFLGIEDLIEFCEFALKGQRICLDNLEKFDCILESPYTSLFLKDKVTLDLISSKLRR